VSYTLLLSMIEFKTLVMRENLEGAMALLPNIPQARRVQGASTAAAAGGRHGSNKRSTTRVVKGSRTVWHSCRPRTRVLAVAV
jgi:hypothetical protein